MKYLEYNLNYFVIFFIIILIFFIPNFFSAEAILSITKTIYLEEQLEFDGLWTDPNEWKPTSQTEMVTDNGLIYLRYAHQDNFIYFLIDAVADKNPEKNSDRAIICFDLKNDKTIFPNEDDYCFISILGKSIGHTLQGGSYISTQNYYKKIPNPENLIAIGNVSNINDRYSPIPHASYEFRIPTDFVGRSNVYGIYVGVFDKSESKMYSWPDSATTHYTKIPSPSTWDELVSPDKTLPEFPLPLVSVVIGILGILIITRLKTKHIVKF